MEKLINDSVGNNMMSEKEDVLNVKGVLNELDRFEENDSHGYITRDLDQSIKTYQSDRNLRIDGIMFPGGETETALLKDIDSKRSGNAAPPVPGRKPDFVQEEKADSRKDCANLEVALANAQSVLDNKQEDFERNKREIEELEEKIRLIDEKVSEFELSQKPVEQGVSALGPITGALGGALLGLGAIGVTKNVAAMRGAAKTGALAGAKMGSEISEKVLELERSKLDLFNAERDDILSQMGSLQAVSQELEFQVSEAQSLVEQAQIALESCQGK